LGFFRRHREETLNEQLLREAGLAEPEPVVAAEEQSAPPKPFPVGPPGPADPRTRSFLGEAFPERPAAWDSVTTAEAPELQGDRYEFATVPDGSLIVDETCNDDLSRLANAVERELAPPYRALAVRQDECIWMVSARKITVLELPLDGDELELSDVGGRRTFVVDSGAMDADAAPAVLVQLGERAGTDYVVQAQRLDGRLWDATTSVL